METLRSLAPIFLLVALVTGFVAGLTLLSRLRRDAEQRWSRKLPLLTFVIAALLAVFLTLQLNVGGLLQLFERDTERVLRGEPWRIVTALFFQDGQLQGGIFNIASLLFIGPVAERVLGYRRWLVIFFGGGVITEAIALALQPQGAGNSIANLSLAGAMLGMTAIRRGGPLGYLISGAGVLAGLLLLALGDIHGVATLGGAAAGSLLAWREQRNKTDSTG
jgi:membrane associated rhomboid family serine protease